MEILIGPVPGWRCYNINNQKIQKIEGKPELKTFTFESGTFDQLTHFFPDNWKPDIIFLERPEYASILKNRNVL